MALAANILIAVVALLHVWFFILERYVWRTPKGRKIFRNTKQQAKDAETLAANQGVYNLCLALGLLWTLISNQIPAATAIKMFILVFICVVGIYGAWTVSRSILLMQVAPSLVALLLLVLSLGNPRINDITTSFSEPPRFASDEIDYNLDFSLIQKKYYPRVLPLVVPLTVEQAFEAVVKVAKAQRSWELTLIDNEKKRLLGNTSTQFFRFTDDFAIEVRPAKMPGIAVIQMRSRSRMGKSDFGVNAQRIVQFFASIDAALAR